MVIQGEMANLPPDSTKYLLIVRAEKFDAGVPLYLKTKYAIHWAGSESEDTLRHMLLKELFDIESAPPLGEPPIFV
jgi:hypothetical protein